MPGRRKKEGLIEVMAALPWWISVATGVIAYCSLRWILPSALPGPLRGIIPMLPTIAWMPLGLFCLLGLVAWSRTASARVRPGTGQVASTKPLAREIRHTVGKTDTTTRDSAQAWGRSSLSPPLLLPSPFITWTIDALRAIEWKRFELLCGKYYQAAGFRISTIPFGADGGIDIKLYIGETTEPIGLVQCKAWNAKPVDVKVVRELLGVMTAETVQRGILITTSRFSTDATALAASNRIQLLDGAGFLKKILALPNEAQTALLQFAFEGDYATPSCTSCGIKMVRRKGKISDFFGCANYPKCKMKIYTKV